MPNKLQKSDKGAIKTDRASTAKKKNDGFLESIFKLVCSISAHSYENFAAYGNSKT